MKTLGKYSIGLGDRFGHQGDAQLKAVMKAAEHGIEITPVWNKSNREHSTIGSHQDDVRIEADLAVRKAGFNNSYFVDADHINIETVEKFIGSSDLFTIDVASSIGKRANDSEIADFIGSVEKYIGVLKIPGSRFSYTTTKSEITKIAEKYLFATLKAWDVYRKIEKTKGRGNFICEISMDEVADPQSPLELFFILRMFASEDIPLQTIAPKFSGRFNKGVDYAGDPAKFAAEFETDLLVIDFAIKEFGLPENLKMSIHSGSDKFAIYPYIHSVSEKYHSGFHLKTAGTTWLEEVIGLALSGGEGLRFVREIYCESLSRIDELSAPYSDVLDINTSHLPSESEVSGWSSEKFADSLKHDQRNSDYNANMRQLIHIAYKCAAERSNEFHRLLESNEKIISECVYENIYNRHICRLFNIK